MELLDGVDWRRIIKEGSVIPLLEVIVEECYATVLQILSFSPTFVVALLLGLHLYGAGSKAPMKIKTNCKAGKARTGRNPATG
jgi:hypothetical protein